MIALSISRLRFVSAMRASMYRNFACSLSLTAARKIYLLLPGGYHSMMLITQRVGIPLASVALSIDRYEFLLL